MTGAMVLCGAGLFRFDARQRTLSRRLIVFCLAVTFLAGLAFHAPSPVSAATPLPQGAQIQSFVQRDLNGDSHPEMAIITATYHGKSYRIEVYDRGRDMQWADSWQAGTDFVDDIWFFRSTPDNVTRLILGFDHDESGYAASLYDDVDGSGSVSYQPTGPTQFRITESPFPTVRIESKQYWILPDGRQNRNVKINSYRPMTSGTGESIDFQDRLLHDGRPGLEQEVVDTDGNGVPDYELVRANYGVPDGWNLFRTFILANPGQRPLADFTDYFLWPYLGDAPGSEKQQYSDFWRIPQDQTQNTAPPIQVDWDRSKIRGVAHFLPMWGLGDEWRLQSWTPVVKNGTSQLGWERFAYYSYSGNANPDMVVRLRQGYPATTVRAAGKDLHLENVAISWKHQNLGTLLWDFKLDLAGLHELPTTNVTFADFSLREVPFAQYPSYYTDQGWAYGTFVAVENETGASNEGIGEWSTLNGVHINDDLPYEQNVVPGSEQGQFDYLVGSTPASPAVYYRGIKDGLRGEYADLNGRQPQLYFGAIDHRLHLLHATFGLWNLGAGREIHYATLGGDYLNQWELFENGKPQAALRYLAGQLIFNGQHRVTITPATLTEAVFTSPPPRTQAEWTALGDRLSGTAPASGPDDFAAMTREFGEPAITLSGASLRDFRAVGRGFRFILTLDPSFAVEASDRLGLRGLPPGDYVVTYDGSFAVSPASAPQLSLTVGHDPDESQPPTVNQPVALQAVVSNAGSEDAVAVVRLRQARDGQVLAWSGPVTVTVPAGGSTPARFGWVPASSGEWEVEGEVRLLGDPGRGDHPVRGSAATSVRPAPQASLRQDVTALGLVTPWQWGLLLGSLALAGAALGWRVFASLAESAGPAGADD